MKKLFSLLALAFATLSFSANAQEALELKPSPYDFAATTTEAGTYVKITYSRPHKRGRVIFGELVPYDKVWRTGANGATEITTTGEIQLGGETIPAGTYSIYTIPGEEEWTIIVSKAVGQWGAYRYDQSSDLVRFTVPAGTTEEAYEPFTIQFNEEAESIDLIWDMTRVAIPFKG